MTSLAPAVRTLIEQALARGRTPARVADDFGLPIGTVHRVVADLERINNEPDGAIR